MPATNTNKKGDLKKFSIYNTKTKQTVNVTNPFGTRAKELYKQLIVANPTMSPTSFLPDGLNWTGKKFMKVKSLKPKIELRSSFKNYLAEVTIRNMENVTGYDGLQLLRGFTDVIDEYLAIHGGITVQAYVKTLMRKYVDGELLAEDGNRWTNSTKSVSPTHRR